MLRSVPEPPPAAAPPVAAPVTLKGTGEGADRFFFTEPLRTRAARGTLINAGFTVGLGVLSLLKGFVLARFLSRADYGLWGVLIVSVSTLLWLKQAGISDKFIQQHDLDQETALQKAFTLELLLTLGCVLLIAAATPIVVLIYDLPQIVLPAAALALALLVSVFQAPIWVYYRRMEFARQRALSAVDPVVGFVASVVLAVLGAGYWAFVGGILIGASAASLVAVLTSPFRLRLRYDHGTLRQYATFSGPLLIGAAASMLTAWSAVIAAKLSLGLAAVGVLALADTITSFTEQLDGLITGSLYPAICAVVDRPTVLYESLVKSNRLALMWAVPFGFGLTLFASDLVRFLIGPRWQPMVTLLQVYGVAAAVNHIGFNWTAYMRAMGRTRAIMTENVAATAAFLATGIPLLLVWGLPGFAAGVAIQCAAAVLFRTYYLRTIFPRFDFLAQAARSFLPSMAGAAVVLALRAAESGSHTAPAAAAELAAFLVVVATLGWRLEGRLLKEAALYLRRVRPAPEPG